MRERRWASLAIANHRADRQAEALAALREARARLVDELGLDLSPRLLQLETDILRQAPELSESPLVVATAVLEDSAACPYRGLAPYEGEDRALFFGRDAEAQVLAERARPRSVVVIVGASGSGKSSVLRAGLVPRLREQGRKVRVVVPSQHGLAALGVVLENDDDVVCLDQAEEPVGATPGELEAFGRAASDWVLRDAADHAGILPALSYALAATWRHRDGATLTIDGYEESGGIAGAIAQSAEEVYHSLGPDEQAVCQALMLRLVERTPDGDAVRRRVPLAAVASDPARRGSFAFRGTAPRPAAGSRRVASQRRCQCQPREWVA